MSSHGWSGTPVFVTGHTGFKGGWLSLWLHHLGAVVHGYALEPPTSPSLFAVADVAEVLATDTRGDVSDATSVAQAMRAATPKVVFHLAAQPLVNDGYLDPMGTVRTNVVGTAAVLDASREIDSVRAIVIVTSDKVYEEGASPHTEEDALGGRDLYSASKAAAEIVVAAYRASFLSSDSRPRVATVRAGNVVGGGDWAPGRLVPDCLRAFEQGKPVRLRRPTFTRPWQHVLDPLAGYLMLATRLQSPDAADFARPWNFGPGRAGEVEVRAVADLVARHWGGDARVERAESTEMHESASLRLDASRSISTLGWHPRWSLSDAIGRTVAWHRAWVQGGDMVRHTMADIEAYEKTAR